MQTIIGLIFVKPFSLPDINTIFAGDDKKDFSSADISDNWFFSTCAGQ